MSRNRKPPRPDDVGALHFPPKVTRQGVAAQQYVAKSASGDTNVDICLLTLPADEHNVSARLKEPQGMTALVVIVGHTRMGR